MSWWAKPECQQDRSTFAKTAEQRLPNMLADPKFGRRAAADYQASFHRAWGPVAPEHRMRKWKEEHGEAA